MAFTLQCVARQLWCRCTRFPAPSVLRTCYLLEFHDFLSVHRLHATTPSKPCDSLGRESHVTLENNKCPCFHPRKCDCPDALWIFFFSPEFMVFLHKHRTWAAIVKKKNSPFPTKIQLFFIVVSCPYLLWTLRIFIAMEYWWHTFYVHLAPTQQLH